MVRIDVVIEEQAHIPAPADRVFSYVANLSTVAEYNPHVMEAKALSEGPPRAGSEFKLVVRLFGLPVSSTLRIVRIDPPRELVLEVQALVPAREVRTFAAAGNDTKLTFRIEFASPVPLVGPLIDRYVLAPAARREARLELVNLARRFA